jgi:hypothetical protein
MDVTVSGDTIKISQVSTQITSIEKNTAVGAFPNPATEYIHVTSEKANISGIEIRSVDGKLLLKTQESVPVQEIGIDTRNFERGLYLLKVNTTNGVRTMRIQIM